MKEQPIYTKNEFLAIFRKAKKRKLEWQEKAIKELTELQKELDKEKMNHPFGIESV